MQCKDVVELLPLFLDVELEPEVTAEIESHLTTCSSCQQLLTEYRREQTILQSLPLVAPPPDWRAELMEKVSPNKRRSNKHAWRYFIPRLGSLAAALLIMVLVTNLYISPSFIAQQDEPDQMRRLSIMLESAPEDAAKTPAAEPKDFGAMEFESAPEAGSLFSIAAAPSASSLQKCWWFWSSALGLVVWSVGAGYYYYRYRRRLQERLE